jgi:hypothetical protein
VSELMAGAGREMDAMVAHRVMGWRVSALNTSPHNGGKNEIRGLVDSRIGGGCTIEHPEWETSYYISTKCEIPPYSTEIAAAWMVVEMMRDRFGAEFLFTFNRLGDARAKFTDPVGTNWHVADTAPLAICLAALKAVAH